MSITVPKTLDPGERFVATAVVDWRVCAEACIPQLGVALIGFSLWVDNTSNPECVRLYGFNAACLPLVLFCYGLPFGFLVVSL